MDRGSAESGSRAVMIFTLPNGLTMVRIAVIPPLVAAFYLEGDLAHWVTAGLFLAASLTDYFDGLVARAWAQQSAFGTFLDPIADKLMVATALFMMVAFDRVSGLALLAALIILCRELLVSGLREWLAEIRVGLPVSILAKWKTTVQMTAITLLLIGDAAGLRTIGEGVLWLAAALTLVTGYDYLHIGLRHMREADDETASEDVAETAARREPGRG